METTYKNAMSRPEDHPARIAAKKLQDTDTEFAVGKDEDGAYVVHIKLGRDPLNERF